MMFSRFPHFKQLDASDCGPASLRMIARFYGVAYSTEMLRNHCHISRYGVTMRGIAECAQYIGFETMGVSLSFEMLAEEGVFPCILHWNQKVVSSKVCKLIFLFIRGMTIDTVYYFAF